MLPTRWQPRRLLPRAVRAQDRVQAALLQLPPDYREAIVLRYFADLSYDEIAQPWRCL